jgi:hypothetical protein
MTRVLFLLSLLASSAPTVVAWGPLHQAIRFGVMQLQMKSDDVGLDEYRMQLEQSYVHSYEDDFNIQQFEDIPSLRKEVKASLNTNANAWTLEAMAACGDDCEECLIPDDLKILPDAQKGIDVMAFLGIQRAEPLRAWGTSNMDWD